MKKLFKVLAIVMAIAVAVTAFAACGGKEDNVTETATTPAGDSAATEATTAAARKLRSSNIILPMKSMHSALIRLSPSCLHRSTRSSSRSSPTALLIRSATTTLATALPLQSSPQLPTRARISL